MSLAGLATRLRYWEKYRSVVYEVHCNLDIAGFEDVGRDGSNDWG